jgi:DNA-binding protein H-NS
MYLASTLARHLAIFSFAIVVPRLKPDAEETIPGVARDEPNEKAPHSNEAKEKHRDPLTAETWSGRGRMASWLKRKQDAGEDIENYRVG